MRLAALLSLLLVVTIFSPFKCWAGDTTNLARLTNPVWGTEDNLRDPSVLKTPGGYYLFYSRFNYRAGPWNAANTWSIGEVFTKDFQRFENDRDISPLSCASPGDCVWWGGRYVLPYQRYPLKPVELCFSVSRDLWNWTPPQPFLEEALGLPWNTEHRAIDPTFIVVGDTLHCFFVGSAMIPDSRGKLVHTNLLGHAVTKDPALKTWKILSTDFPVLGPSAQGPDGVENVAIFKTGADWTMIYSEGLINQHLARATSPDLQAWTLQGEIKLHVQQWMARRYGAPYVWRDGSQWLMILMGENAATRTSFGLLSSGDGKDWTLNPEARATGDHP